MWQREFKAQDYGRAVYKHKDFPVYVTDEFNFYRCVEFQESFYGKTVSTLHNGNLRACTGRYAKLFPNQKLSYWANTPETARAEIKHRGAKNDIITFWAYDDATSTFPTLDPQEPLWIIDGRKSGIQYLIDKLDNNEFVTEEEQTIVKQIMSLSPDCLVYDSHAKAGGENYIFFEKGFRKLALRQVRLHLGTKNGNRNTIVCADGSDYTPYIEGYGCYFAPIARVKMDENYLLTEEYRSRKKVLDESYQKIREFYDRRR